MQDIICFDGEQYSREQAKNYLRFLVEQIEKLPTDDERFNEIKDRAGKLEEALGY